MSFYLTLPSPAYQNGENKDKSISNFITRLPHPLHLSAEEWEVGLAEVIYPLSLLNIKRGKLITKSGGMTYISSAMVGEYSSFSEIIEELQILQSHLRRGVPRMKVEYSKISNKFTITVERGVHVAFIGDLADIMGFQRGKLMGNGEHTSFFPPSLRAKNELLYVYGSFVAPRPVGNTRAQLLRVFPVAEAAKNKIIRKEFEQIHYVPIANLSSETIEIDIRRDDGTLPPFYEGEIVLTVHFRRKTPSS